MTKVNAYMYFYHYYKDSEAEKLDRVLSALALPEAVKQKRLRERLRQAWEFLPEADKQKYFDQARAGAPLRTGGKLEQIGYRA